MIKYKIKLNETIGESEIINTKIISIQRPDINIKQMNNSDNSTNNNSITEH